jgi:NarL family two-component system sensor histidine kinase YdfH
MHNSRQRLYRLFGWTDRATASIAVVFYLIMSIAFAVLGVNFVRSQSSAMEPIRWWLFAVLLAVHSVLHWFGLRLISGETRSWRRQVAYCVIQAGLVVSISVLTSEQDITIALWITLLAETAALLWPEWRSIVLSASFYLCLLALNVILMWGIVELVELLPTTGLLIGGFLLYALVLVREGWSRQKAQTLVQQLERTQSQLKEYAEQVEELTISQERQRMARELHDTLAQGLTGLILQLEAADSHLESERPAEAQSIVQLAMKRARETLHEARRAIQALRSAALDQNNLAAALAGEVAQFEARSGIEAAFSFEGKPEPISSNVAQNVLRIVQESLSNVVRHAQAHHVEVRLVQNGPRLRLVVKDDGKGFDVQAAMGRQECFGLQGMHERAGRIGATLWVESTPQGGTELILSLQGTPEPVLDRDRPAQLGTIERAESSEVFVQ